MIAGMLRTPVCDLLGIEVPVVAAPFGPWEQVDLAAAVCEAGGLGSVGTAVRGRAELEAQWARLRELTQRPFAINHTTRPFDEQAFAATLRFRPAAVSFHLGVPGDLIARAHAAGALWIQQVMDRAQAEQALEAGADVIVAQGGEAGGTAGGCRRWCWSRRSSIWQARFRCSPRGESRTVVAWWQRSRSGRRACAWALVSWRRTRWLSRRNEAADRGRGRARCGQGAGQ